MRTFIAVNDRSSSIVSSSSGSGGGASGGGGGCDSGGCGASPAAPAKQSSHAGHVFVPHPTPSFCAPSRRAFTQSLPSGWAVRSIPGTETDFESATGFFFRLRLCEIADRLGTGFKLPCPISPRNEVRLLSPDSSVCRVR